MEDKKIELLLKQYMEKEMDLIAPEEMEGFEHNFSKKFSRKLKQIMRGEKYLGRHIRFMRPIRYAAIFAVSMVGILAAGTVSARMFHFQPWKYITSFKPDDKTEEKIYTHSNNKDSAQPETQAVVKKKIPSYVPEGMKQKDIQETSILFHAEWENREGKHISYVRAVIAEGLKSSTDAEYQSKRSIVIAGYKGFLYRKNNEMWIDWDDAEYNHYISSMGIEDENELVKMGESLYESGETKN